MAKHIQNALYHHEDLIETGLMFVCVRCRVRWTRDASVVVMLEMFGGISADLHMTLINALSSVKR